MTQYLCLNQVKRQYHIVLIVKNYYISLTVSEICLEARIIYEEDHYYERYFTLICKTFLTRHLFQNKSWF